MTATRGARAVIAALALALLGLALLAPVNHDESQYLAAAALARHGAPYRDFALLQTPLFAWWGAWWGAALPGYSLIAGRIVQAATGALVLWLVARAARAGGAGPGGTGAAVAVVAASYPFLFAVSVVRNDLLAMLCETAALALLVPAAQHRAHLSPARLAGAGALIGLAAAAKVNFALVGAAPALWLLVAGPSGEGPRRRRQLAALAAGGTLGFAPALLAAAAAPHEAWWQVVTFAAEAPRDWYTRSGEGWRLGLAGHALDAGWNLVQGPLAIALALVARARWRARRIEPAEPDARPLLLDLTILAALAAALVPVPSWRQYFVVVLPPLALRLAALWPQVPREWRRAFALFAAVGAVCGAIRAGSGVPRWDRGPIAQTRAAHAIAALGTGRIATLASDLAVDSGHPLDPAFAAGPFVWRWPGAPASANAPAPARIEAHFAARPPGLVVTGREGALDAPLEDWARRHRYRLVTVDPGGWRVWLAPLAAPPGAG